MHKKQGLVLNEVQARQNNKVASTAIEALGTDIEKVFFNCECSVKTWQQKIALSTAKYRKIHENGNRFLIFPHHEMDAVESVIERNADYWVVQKYNLAATKVASL